MRMTFLLALTVSALSSMAGNEPENPHKDRMLKEFDTSRWRGFCQSSDWHIRCVFADIDGDDVEEMFALTSLEEDRSGDMWNLWKTKADGRFHRVDCSGDLSFTCREGSFYRVVRTDGSCMTIGLSYNRNVNNSRVSIQTVPDCEFVMPTAETYSLRPLQPDFDAVFRRADIREVQRLYPEWYYGYGMESPSNQPHTPQRYFPPYVSPRGNPARCGGLKEPAGFLRLIETYRKAMESEAKVAMKKLPVYAVLLDVDNDGDVDVYVTSEVNHQGGGEYLWQLYLQDNGRFNEACQPIEQTMGVCRWTLPRKVLAQKASFCRVLRVDTDPLFLIIDPKQKDQVRKVAHESNTYRIEKLECKEYSL